MNYKEHFPLIGAVALPIIFICGVLIYTLPNRHVETAYNLIIARCPQQSGYWRPCAVHADATYHVEGRKLVKRAVPPPPVQKGETPTPFIDPVLELYNPSIETVTTLNPEAAAVLAVVSPDTSPDGVRVEYRYGRGGDFFIFGSNGGRSGWYLTKGTAAKRIDASMLGIDQYTGPDQIEILGWVAQ